MNTLTESAPERTRSAMNATAKLVVAPSTIEPTPNRATVASSTRPTWRRTGRTVRNKVTAPAPMPIAARSHPSPTAPTPSRSWAIAGSSAIAPPNSTAKRSSEIAPRRTGSERTKRSPANASRSPPRGRSTTTATAGPHERDRDGREQDQRSAHEVRDAHSHDVEKPADDRTHDGCGLPRHGLARHEPRESLAASTMSAGSARSAGVTNACAVPKATTSMKNGDGRGRVRARVPGQPAHGHRLGRERDARELPPVDPVRQGCR
jgi:hypothetical protein